MESTELIQPKTLSIKDIARIIPHRYPFLLVDKILELDFEKGTIVGQKNLTFNEAFFQGHFPENPIMPGVLILEALAQTSGVLIDLKIKSDKLPILLNVNNVKFRNPVRPGDVLKMHCEAIHFSSKGARFKAEAFVDGRLAAQAEIGFALVHINLM